MQDQSQSPATGRRGRRIPELDALRGLAVLMVMIYHQNHAWLPGGGKMGVGLFFVLSGFLITSILVRERERRGAIRLGAFYARRVRRLLPALAGFCAGWWLWVNATPTAWAGIDGAQRLNLSILQAATFTSNLARLFDWEIFPYFRHAWSLAVEEQFYLVWPAVLLLLFGLRSGRARVGWVLGIAAALALVRLWLWSRGVSYKVLYDTMQWDGLLLGCALALSPRLALPRWTVVPAVVAFVALLAIHKSALPQFATLDFVVQALSCAVILHHAVRWHWLAQPLLVHLGLISYSLYLWHYPFTKMWDWWIAVPASLAAAELSYWLVERSFYRARGSPARSSALVAWAARKLGKAGVTVEGAGNR
ncbi:MAG: acyltransferase [Proteobacteria bacterium]|nr:acyltransferase [Pseudomonadota bacterium]